MLVVLVGSLLLAAGPAKPVSPFSPRPRPYDALHYRIDTKVGEGGAFDNKLTLTLKPKQATSELELDAFGLSIASASIDGHSATFTEKADPGTRTGSLLIKASKPLSAGKEVTIEITYSGRAGTAHDGFFTVPNPGGLPYFFTHFEPTSAQRFFPCNDQPDDKATTEIIAVVDGSYQVLSNGKREKDEAFSEGGKNLRRVHWKQEQLHSTYLVALAIGQFDSVDVAGDLPAKIYVPKGTASRAFTAQNFTNSALSWQATFLGVRYPWAKFDQVAIPNFLWYGMENTSIVFARDNMLVAEDRNDIAGRSDIVELIAHELAHQWFGDAVTLKGWEDAWLNEGFATYLGRRSAEIELGSDALKVDGAVRTFVHYMRSEDGPRSHALVSRTTPSVDDMFDSTSYAKGASVLQMLEHWLGQAELRKVFKAYLEKYAYSNATSDDFFATLFAVTKKEKELRPFKESWLKKRGYPVLFPTASYGGGTLTLTVRQQANHPDEKGSPFVFKLPITVHRQLEPAYSKDVELVVDKMTATAKLEVPAAPEWINWNRGGLALAKINSASVTEQEWLGAARHDPDPVWRTLALLVLLGEQVNPDATEQTKPTDAALGAVIDALGEDPSPYVRAAVMRQMSASKWRRLPSELGPVVYKLARRPEKLNEDPLGLIAVRSSAMELLGKLDHAEGKRYVLDELGKGDVDPNFLPGLAAGAARMGDSVALASLRAAVATVQRRGAYFRPVAAQLGRFEGSEVLPAIGELLKSQPNNLALMRDLVQALEQNRVLMGSDRLPPFVRDLVLDGASSVEVRARCLGLLDDVKTPAAKEALLAIAQKSDIDRLKLFAQQTLAKNFQPPAAAPPAKGKK